MERIIFCDFDPNFVNVVRKIKSRGGISISTMCCDIREAIGHPNSAFVSPANSFLWYDGGIDGFYELMFPQLQRDIHHKIREYPYRVNTDYDASPMLPIGSALIIPVKCGIDFKWYHLIAAPTMETPQKIVGKDYPYWATLATLAVVAKFNKKNKESPIKTLILPGMGTGVGCITPEESVRQIDLAISDFLINKNLNDELPDDCNVYINNPCNKKLIRVIDDPDL